MGSAKRAWYALGVALVFLVAPALGAPLGVVQALERIWGEVTYNAAEATLSMIQQSTGLELALRDVPLESARFFMGSRHTLGIDVDGVSYEVTLDDSNIAQREASRALPALPPGSALDSPAGHAVVARDWMQRQQRSITLPEVALSGPLEIVLSQPAPVSVFTPHAADIRAVHRVRLEAG